MQGPEHVKKHTLGGHLRSRLISGVLALVPLVITILVLRFVGGLTASFLQPLVRLVFGDVHPVLETVLAVLGVLVLIYVVGLVTTHIIGQRLIALADRVMLRVPIVRSIYSASKQLVDTLRTTSRTEFKSVVLVPFPTPAAKCIGFVTGVSTAKDGKRIFRVFVPTTPNPTSGFFLLIEEAHIEQTSMTVEDAIKMIMSGGMLGAEQLAGDGTLPG